jgi:CRISPR-associated exonuclease Cas4
MGWTLSFALGGLGLSLLVLSLRARRARGLGAGETVTLDDVTLFSKRHLLSGRPDRIVKHGKFFIPEEWKSSKEVEFWHLVQLGVYFILIEDHYGVRPPYGFIVLQGGRREQVMNSAVLREGVLAVAAEIRVHRKRLGDEIWCSPRPWQCRVCGQRSRCRRASLQAHS